MIYVVNDPASMTVNARMINEGSSDTDTLNFNYDVTDESLLESIDADALLEENEEFTIGADNAFVLNVTIPLSEPLTADELSGGIEGYVTDIAGNEIYRFSFDHIEEA